jgi:hypothetical protein
MAKKHAAKMTDKELVRRLFPTVVRKQLKTTLLALNAKKKSAPKKTKA